MAIFWAVLASLSVSGALLLGAYAISRPKLPKTAPEPDPPSTPEVTFFETLAARVAALEVTVDGLPSLWEEERKRAINAQKRAEEAERSLRKRQEREQEGEDDDWEGQEVLPLNEAAGPGNGVQPMRPSLGGHPDAAVYEKARALGWPWI